MIHESTTVPKALSTDDSVLRRPKDVVAPPEVDVEAASDLGVEVTPFIASDAV